MINNCVLQQSPYWLDSGPAPILINCVRIFRCGPVARHQAVINRGGHHTVYGGGRIWNIEKIQRWTSEWKSTAFIFNGFSHGIDSDLFGNWRLIWTKAWRLQSCWKLIHLRWDLNCCELGVDCGCAIGLASYPLLFWSACNIVISIFCVGDLSAALLLASALCPPAERTCSRHVEESGGDILFWKSTCSRNSFTVALG